MSDEHFYGLIAEELAKNETDSLLWTRALGESGGDSEKTKSLYIRLRLSALKRSAAPSFSQSRPDPANENQQPPLNNGLFLLRAELTETLRKTKKSTFYSVLNITPEAPDSLVASAIAEYEANIDNGTVTVTPAFNYAKETLGNLKSREVYDRRLYERFTIGGPIPVSGRGSEKGAYVEGDSLPLSIWSSRKASVVVGVISVAVVGYVLLGFYKERGVSAARQEAIAVQKLQASGATESDATRAGTERVLVHGVIRNSEKAIESQGHVANRIVGVQESAESRNSRELEYRAKATEEVLRQQQQKIQIAKDQIEWQRNRYEEAKSERENNARVASDRRHAIQLMIADSRYSEARGFARTDQERAMVDSAERASREQPRGYRGLPPL